MDLAISAIFNLNNIKYHRKQNFANFYLYFGTGGQFYKTMVDQLDDDGNRYNYAAVRSLTDESDPRYALSVNASNSDPDREEDGKRGFLNFSERKELKDAVEALYGGYRRDRDYETPAEGMDREDQSFFKWSKNATFHAGFGIEFLLTDWFVLGIESRNTWTIGDDLVDGQRWSEQGDLTRRFDNYNQTDLKLAFNLGKSSKRELPMWWRNPNERNYQILTHQPDLRKVEEKVDEVTEDDDKDGVINKFDAEPNTPINAIVDSRGRVLDSDKDGCPDHEDPEPYSTPLLPIKDCKNVYDFAEKACCDETTKAAQVIAAPTNCNEIKLPSIHFDDDRYNLKPEFYAHLHEVARKMQDCPDLRVVANGHTDTRNDVKYNEQLSWNRVNASINYLVEKYGISRDRFLVTYSGERAPLNDDGSAIEKYENRRVEFRFAEEGETGSSNPPAPHPGINAGKNK